jgi:hypothetical protein
MNWTSAGDLGDIVVALCVAKHAAPKSTLLLREDGRTKGIVKRKDIIIPLVESQPYITACRPFAPDDQVDWPSEQFRRGYHSPRDTLMSAHARHAQAIGLIPTLPSGAEPWLTISAPDHGRVVINRTSRYNNPAFPWQKAVDHYSDKLLFVGTEQEHQHFQNCFGQVEYQPTKNLLEVAKFIKGSALFIGNQSCAMAIAEGLKHPRIQETCLHIPDCIYPGSPNAQYVATPDVTLSTVGDTPALTIDEGLRFSLRALMPFREVPRCGWTCQVGAHTVSASTPERTAQQVAKFLGIPEPQAAEMVLAYVLKKDAGFFRRFVVTSHLTTVASALQGAGITSHPVHDALAGRITFIP